MSSPTTRPMTSAGVPRNNADPAASPTLFEDERWVTGAGGVQLWARLTCTARPAPATPLLILDGIGCSGWAFRRMVPELAAARDVLQVHYRGHGRSPDPPRPWHLSMPVLADDAAAAMATYGLERAIAVGFSMGFQVAVELYRRHRSNVAGLVSLAGPAGRALAQFQGTDVFAHLLPLVRAASRRAQDMTRKLWRTILPSRWLPWVGLHTQLNPMRIEIADLEFYLSQMAAMNPELFLDMLGEASRHVGDDILPAVRVPSLVVAGAHDKFVPIEVLRRLAFAMPTAQWMVIDDGSHALPAEFSAELADRLLDFAAEVDAAAP